MYYSVIGMIAIVIHLIMNHDTVTYKQLMAEKLKNQNIISLYKIYGLIEE